MYLQLQFLSPFSRNITNGVTAMVMFLKKKLNVIHEIIVYSKKNLFIPPKSQAGGDYVAEITQLLNA